MAEEITTEQAKADLARADDVAGRVRRHARWMWLYLAVFAAGFGGITLILGLVQPLWLRMTIFGVLWPYLVVGMVVWSRQQPAASRDGRRRALWAWVATPVLYSAAVWVGTPSQLGRVAYWLPAAVVVAVPLAVAAWRERRA
jgi:hypothetical protein